MELANKVKTNFISHFGKKQIILAKAPGRINLIGEHVDYNDGFAFPAAIDMGVVVAVAKSESNECKVIALDYEETYQFKLERLEHCNGGGWRNYILGIVSEIQKRNLTVRPFQMAFTGNIPPGAGLSSSAALENSMVFALNELFELGLEKKEMINIAQTAEHEFVGVKCGIMDQYASMYGMENHFLLLDCRSLEAIPYYADLGDHELVLLNTNVQHALSDSAYNDRRSVCEKIADRLGKVALRDIYEEDLLRIRNEITRSEFQKALFVIQEIRRAKQAAEFLKGNDMNSLGRLLFSSHSGLKNQYMVSCPELDFLVGLAMKDNTVLGARMMGGGFGGCTLNLVYKKGSQKFINAAKRAYKQKFGVACDDYRVKISEGTRLITE